MNRLAAVRSTNDGGNAPKKAKKKVLSLPKKTKL